MSGTMRIQGGAVLVDGAFVDTDVDLADGAIAAIGREAGNGRALDARGLAVLPGIIDIHGDAFERQLMPRPGVHFATPVGLKDSDRQVIARPVAASSASVVRLPSCSGPQGRSRPTGRCRRSRSAASGRAFRACGVPAIVLKRSAGHRRSRAPDRR